jgi:transposase-like protein
MMNQFFIDFPNDDIYKEYLLTLRWKTNVICPYCGSIKCSRGGSSFIFHCNNCNSNYSLTVNTVMHNTKVELRKWLVSLHYYLNDENLSYRKLSLIIDVNKNTAYRIVTNFQLLFSKKRLIILKLAGLKKNNIEIMSLMLLIDIKRRI